MIEEEARRTFDVFDDYVKIQYDVHHLQNLLEYPIRGESNSLSFFFNVVREKSARKQFSDHELYSDFDLITKNLKYVIGLLFFFRPFINNPVSENGTYFQNIYDKRYMMYVEFAYQLIYNFGDGIGDLLAIFFDTGLGEKTV